MKTFFSINLVSAGFFIALLCAIHCILTPILIIALPLIGHSFIASENFESLIITRLAHTEALEVPFSLAGGLCIAIAHIKNWQLCGTSCTNGSKK